MDEATMTTINGTYHESHKADHMRMINIYLSNGHILRLDARSVNAIQIECPQHTVKYKINTTSDTLYLELHDNIPLVDRPTNSSEFPNSSNQVINEQKVPLGKDFLNLSREEKDKVLIKAFKKAETDPKAFE